MRKKHRSDIRVTAAMTPAEHGQLLDIIEYLVDHGGDDAPATISEAIRFAVRETHARLTEAASEIFH